MRSVIDQVETGLQYQAGTIKYTLVYKTDVHRNFIT